jgi:hypothetical protein
MSQQIVKGTNDNPCIAMFVLTDQFVTFMEDWAKLYVLKCLKNKFQLRQDMLMHYSLASVVLSLYACSLALV